MSGRSNLGDAVGTKSAARGCGPKQRRLRRSCEARVRALPLPEPFDVDEFCRSVQRSQGRTVELIGRSFPAGSPSGLCVSTATADYIFYESGTSALHREHIILHELGHLICGHHALDVTREEVTRLLLPDLDPRVIRRVLGRTGFPMWAEEEAETIASLILAKVERQRGARVVPVASGDVDSAVARIGRSLRGGPESAA